MNISLSDLTVCIFTHENKSDLERIVKFWSYVDVKTIIIDASNQPVQFSIRQNLTYLHAPNMPLHLRLLKFTEHVDTKYTLLSPDDDFFSPRGLSRIICFLEKNPDFSSAQGLRVRFFDFPKFHWIPDYVNQIRLEFIEEDKIKRLNDMAPRMHYIYSVMRSQDFSKIVNNFHGVNTKSRDSLPISELIFNYTLPLLGKHRILPLFYSARKAHQIRWSNLSFSDWINDHTDSDQNILKSNIVDFYISELKCSESLAQSLFAKLTKDFTEPKQSKIACKNPYKIVIKRIITRSRLRAFRSFLKIRYIDYYYLLIKNQNFLSFVHEMRSLKRFLYNNRINHDTICNDKI